MNLTITKFAIDHAWEWPSTSAARKVHKRQTASEIGKPGNGAFRDYEIIHDRDLRDGLARIARDLLHTVHEMLEGVILPQHSRVCAKRYTSGGGQGWHVDGNDVTALLYLDSPTQGGQTIIQTHDGCAPEEIAPEAGKLIIFPGREMLHMAARCPTTKTIIILNLYRPGTYECRPPELDAIVYGGRVD